MVGISGFSIKRGLPENSFILRPSIMYLKIETWGSHFAQAPRSSIFIKNPAPTSIKVLNRENRRFPILGLETSVPKKKPIEAEAILARHRMRTKYTIGSTPERSPIMKYDISAKSDVGMTCIGKR
mmetsp:Transcript_29333/g.50683  ORF Transcript_29333/g.50683 Transcript_29333/m.50683 type:complete len:125 (-) Transcript_29333:155-529(-)